MQIGPIGIIGKYLAVILQNNDIRVQIEYLNGTLDDFERNLKARDDDDSNKYKAILRFILDWKEVMRNISDRKN